jgi:hypothetical protein
MKVPFEPTPDVVNSWLRNEKPSPKRLDALIDAQDPAERAELRRLLRGAAQAIVAEPEGTADRLATIDARNHAQHLLDDGVLTRVDPTIIDPNAEAREQLVEALAIVDNQQALLLEQAQIVARLEERITELENATLELEEAAVEVAPAPTAEELAIARSAAILDEDLDANELRPWNAALPVVAAEGDEIDELFGGTV